ncbi:ABC transporter permease [Pelagicoccus sp. SDUM812003]|uniref:ABC transporter permease n=1 Tax=Pelagicoccus sp. SDUM812003 TaxID=3041267 RepID=UPI00280FEB17|nr:ABC transporter permease [Pelagicoccus sp. SDUM812003]MDQ8204253.1 ABC transporter permease [Pelagicoccus sp. SDUM812003]
MNFLKHRNLIYQFTKRQIQLQYRGSYMGAVWTLLSPLLMLMIYSYVFGFIYGGSFEVVTNETPYQHAAAILIGITLFGYFSDILAISPTAVSSNPNFVKKVVFPLQVLPISHVTQALYNAIIKFVFSAILIAFFCDRSAIPFLYLPIIIIPMFLAGVGISMILSSLAIYIKDISNFIGFLNMALLFSSAVFYGTNLIPDEAWEILKYNPLIHFIEWTRFTLLWQTGETPANIYYIYGTSISVFFLGTFVFNRLKESFADVI